MNNHTVIPERRPTHLHSFQSQENTNQCITEPSFVHTQREIHGWVKRTIPVTNSFKKGELVEHFLPRLGSRSLTTSKTKCNNNHTRVMARWEKYGVTCIYCTSLPSSSTFNFEVHDNQQSPIH
jgi:hypothetical protein